MSAEKFFFSYLCYVKSKLGRELQFKFQQKRFVKGTVKELGVFIMNQSRRNIALCGNIHSPALYKSLRLK